jgi:ABC-2 type transport system permease protein
MTALSKMGQAGAVTPDTLWRQRFTKYAAEAAAYWRDVARSGFVLVAVAAVLGGAYEYGILLQRLPANFPYLWIVMAVMVPSLALGSVRTLVQEADRVFLLPLEGRLGGYFRRAWLYSYAVQAVRTAAALLALWPLYARCAGAGNGFGGSALPLGMPSAPSAQPAVAMLATALVLKAAMLAAAWRETRLADARARKLAAAARWAAAAMLVPLWFAAGAGWAWLGGAAVAMLYQFLLYNRRNYAIGWETLLAAERAHRRRLYGWFRFFTDVPQLPAQVRRRSWLAKPLSCRLAIRQEHTYIYLYGLTLLRTELFGMYARWTLVGLALVWFMSEPWLKGLFLLGFPLIGLVQLSALADTHRYTFWLELYPLRRTDQAAAVLSLITPLAAAQVALLSAAYAITAAGAAGGAAAAAVPLASLAAVLLALRFRLRPSLRRRFAAE